MPEMRRDRVDTPRKPSTIPRMVRPAVVCSILLFLAGCEGSSFYSRSNLDQQMFGPASVRIHPTFTQVRNLAGDKKPDGIEATLEIEDQFGEPTRSTGRAMFELYDYVRNTPGFRGARLGGPWIIDLDTRGEQQEHWNPALRAYTFQLPYPKVDANRYYVLTVQFDLNNTSALTQPSSAPSTGSAGRLFDQLIIEPQNEQKAHGPKQHAPTGTPEH